MMIERGNLKLVENDGERRKRTIHDVDAVPQKQKYPCMLEEGATKSLQVEKSRGNERTKHYMYIGKQLRSTAIIARVPVLLVALCTYCCMILYNTAHDLLLFSLRACPDRLQPHILVRPDMLQPRSILPISQASHHIKCTPQTIIHPNPGHPTTRDA